MEAIIKINLDNAAFEDYGLDDELSRILLALSDQVKNNSLEGLYKKVYDINGNAVGTFEIVQ